DRRAGAALELVPGAAAELGELGRLGVDAHVARNLADLLVRNIEAVVAAEREQKVVARDARHLAGLEAEQVADAVVLVDHVIARAQLRERLECPARRGRAARPAAEDLSVREQSEPEVPPDEAA